MAKATHSERVACKKKMKKLAFMLIPFMASGVTLADSSYRYATSNDQKLSIGVTRYSELYEEFVDGKKFMQEKSSNMTGVEIEYERALSANSKFSLKAGYATGTSTYTGAYTGGNYGDLIVSGLDRSKFELESNYKTTFAALQNLTLGAGLGYRHHEDHLEQAGPGGYNRRNNRLYATIGMERIFTAGSGVTVTPAVQYKQILWSVQSSDIGNYTENTQHSGNGVDVAIAMAFQGEKMNFVFTPYYRTWNVKKSDVSPDGSYEPKNKTRELGITAALQF